MLVDTEWLILAEGLNLKADTILATFLWFFLRGRIFECGSDFSKVFWPWVDRGRLEVFLLL